MELALWAVAIAIGLLLAVGTFLLYRKRRLEPAPVEALSELIPESKFVSLGDARIHYVQAGRGNDLVLLHGIGASVFVWRFLFPLLQGRYRVTAIDLPGFGQSSKERARDYGLDAQSRAVAEILSVIGINKAVLVGSSMGGAIALWMAKLYPERFEKVATLAPATDSRRLPTQLRHFAVLSPILRRTLNRRLIKRLVGRVVVRQTLITDAVVDAYMKPFFSDQGVGVRSFWAAMSLLSDRRLPAGLRGLKADILVIFGARDLLVTRRSIDRLMRVLPEAKLVVNEDGGHHIMEDEPVWTAQTLEAFVSGLRTPGS